MVSRCAGARMIFRDILAREPKGTREVVAALSCEATCKLLSSTDFKDYFRTEPQLHQEKSVIYQEVAKWKVAASSTVPQVSKELIDP